MLHELRVKGAYPFRGYGQVEGEARPSAEVEHHMSQCLVQGGGELPEAMDTLPIP